MDRVSIFGDPYKGQVLTRTNLKEHGLYPYYKIDIANTKPIHTSVPFLIADDRVAFLAYTDYGSRYGLVARIFYRSNSQGIWRFLPAYRIEENGDIHYVKWSSTTDSMVNLAFPLQSALTKLARRGKPVVPRGINSDLLDLGTVRNSKEPGSRYLEPPVNFYRPDEEQLSGNFHSTRNGLIAPHEMTFEAPDNEPNFDHRLEVSTRETSLYGPVLVEVFPSFDGKYRYMFCRDAKGRVWIGGVENCDPIWPIGIRETFVNAGDLTTPPWEYYSDDDPAHDFTAVYGNHSKRLGPYADMFDNYLSKIPVIQRYLRERGKINRASHFLMTLKDRLDL